MVNFFSVRFGKSAFPSAPVAFARLTTSAGFDANMAAEPHSPSVDVCPATPPTPASSERFYGACLEDSSALERVCSNNSQSSWPLRQDMDNVSAERGSRPSLLSLLCRPSKKHKKSSPGYPGSATPEAALRPALRQPSGLPRKTEAVRKPRRTRVRFEERYAETCPNCPAHLFVTFNVTSLLAFSSITITAVDPRPRPYRLSSYPRSKAPTGAHCPSCRASLSVSFCMPCCIYNPISPISRCSREPKQLVEFAALQHRTDEMEEGLKDISGGHLNGGREKCWGCAGEMGRWVVEKYGTGNVHVWWICEECGCGEWN